MSLATRLSDLVTRVATEFKTVKTKISGNTSADLTGLNTTAKNNLVAAINEVLAAVGSAGTGDMTKATYDSNNDGVVDNAAALGGVAAANYATKAYADAKINDAAAAATTTYSSNEIIARLATLKNEILGGASSAYDTLLEIQNALAGDDADIASLLTAVGNRIRFDAGQSLTAPQLQQAQDNISVYSRAEIGNPEQNLVTAFEAALL
jgi:hypothetical protein